MYQQIYSLSGGEISRRLWSRSDMGRYYASVAQLRNFFTSPFGGVVRRPGFQHVATFDTTGIRLIPFRYSAETTFILAFGHQKVRFYSNGAEVTVLGSPYEVATPYSYNELSDLRWEQVLDEVFLVHPNYTPRRLFRVADDSWTLGEWGITAQPFMDTNTGSQTVTASGTTGSVTLSSSAALWNANHVGAHWRIGHIRTANAQAKVITSTGATTSLLISGVYTIRSTGTFTATIELQASVDNSVWETLKSWTVADDFNIEHRGSIDAPLYIRANVTSYTSATGSPRVVIEADESLVWGSAKITAYSSSTSVTATVQETLQSTAATTYWAEGSWSADNGYPSQIILHDGRMCLASTVAEPLTVWMSVVDDYPNFRQVAGYPDYAIQRTLYSPTADQIQWLASRNGALIVGTAGDEWVIRNAADPDTASAQKSSAYGSADVGVVELNDSLLFVQRKGTKIRDYIGLDVNDDLARDPYSANDLTLVAEHVTRAGVTQLSVSQQPDSVLWCVTDGMLAGLTYERNQEVMGWHIHETEGTIESVATIPGDYGDEVWIAVLRNSTRRIERFHPATLDAALDGDTDACLFLDAGKIVDLGTPGTTVTGLSHLNGLEVSVLVDGGEHTNKTVSGGSITLDRSGTIVAVGLAYESLIETLPLVAQTQQGSTRHQIGRGHRIIVDLHESFGVEYSDAVSHTERWYPLQTRHSGDTPNVPPPLDTMPVIATLAASHNRQPRVKIRQTKPLPATILSLAISWNQTQDE